MRLGVGVDSTSRLRSREDHNRIAAASEGERGTGGDRRSRTLARSSSTASRAVRVHSEAETTLAAAGGSAEMQILN